MGKYRSRRQLKKYKKKGGGIEAVAAENTKFQVPKQAAVHTSAHHPEDLVKVVQSQPEAQVIEHAKGLLETHAKVDRIFPRFPRYKLFEPDTSINLDAMAHSIYKRHTHQELPKVGGGLDVDELEQVVDVARKIGDPIKSAQKAKGSYDRVNFNDTSARGIARSTLSAYAGNFHVSAAHQKTGGLLIPGAQVLTASGNAFDLVGDGLDTASTWV